MFNDPTSHTLSNFRENGIGFELNTIRQLCISMLERLGEFAAA